MSCAVLVDESVESFSYGPVMPETRDCPNEGTHYIGLYASCEHFPKAPKLLVCFGHAELLAAAPPCDTCGKPVEFTEAVRR